jgi:SAM-dependent methyltransferase
MTQESIQLKQCDISRDPIPFDDETFDVVIMTEVLEHLVARHERVLGEIRRVMKNGGKLIFSVPNAATLNNRIRFLYGVNPAKWEFNEEGAHGHLHEFSMSEATWILQRSGFTIIEKKFIDNCRRRNTLIPRDDRPRWVPIPSCRQALFFQCRK